MEAGQDLGRDEWSPINREHDVSPGPPSGSLLIIVLKQFRRNLPGSATGWSLTGPTPSLDSNSTLRRVLSPPSL